MSLSLHAEVEVLGLLQRPAVLWRPVALVSVLEQVAASVVSTMGVNISQRWRPLQGCLVGLGGMGTSASAAKQLGGPGLAEVPSLSPVPVLLPSRWCNLTANATATLPLFPPPSKFPKTHSSPSSTFSR